jgi:uncharacterized protein YdeI (YjbR/CyaY-like superfamily)
MMGAADKAPIVTVRNRAELRDWLAANHASATTLWLATYKRHHPDYLDYKALVEELLCWGWIDSLPRALDHDRTMIMIAQRSPKSGWSAVNKAHDERARASGAMTPAGEARITVAMANGMWDFLNDVDALTLPDDLAAALIAGDAMAGYNAYPPSIKRGTLEWVKTAKSPGTRTQRIAEVALSAASGLRPKPFRR